MSVDQFLHLFIENNSLIIEIIVVAIVFLMAVMVFIMIKKGPEGESSAGQLSDIEATLKKVLAQAENLPNLNANNDSSSNSGAAAAENEKAMAVSSEELTTLQAVVAEQKQKIVKLEEESSAAPVGSAEPVDTDKIDDLNTKIQALEAQLQEYEVIEDDIADLSLFKEENASLKKELEGLKSGNSTDTATAEPVAEVKPQVAKVELASQNPAAEGPVPVEKATPEPVAESPKPVVDDAPAVEASESEPEGSSFVEGKVDSAEEYITDDILAEFSAAVDKEFGHASEPEDREAKAKANPEVATEAEAADPQSAVDAAIDAAAVEPAPEPMDPQAAIDAAIEVALKEKAAKADAPTVGATEGEEINTDKMLEEMAALNSVEADDSGLEESTDLEKMAAEATKLTVK